MPDSTVDPNQNDLIIASDDGKFFVIKMDAKGDPQQILPLDPALSNIPIMLQDAGTTLAIMPDAPAGGGCTCVLLNMKSIRASLNSLRPQPNKEIHDTAEGYTPPSKKP